VDRFLSIEAFVRVAECGSFAEASRQLRVTKSVVSDRVQQLEAFVGAPLLHRTTRSVRLSEVGQAFFRDCVELIGRANDLSDQMRELQRSPTGRLRIHALPGFVLGHLARVLRDFQERHPGVALELVVNDAVVDPVRDGFDCTLQIFPPSSELLVERRLFPVRRVFCATDEYLARHGAPTEPAALRGHRLGLYSRYPTRDRWTFHGDGEPVTIELKPALDTNSVHLLREYALEHAGIVCLPTLVAGRDIVAGRLRLVLPDRRLSSFQLSAVYSTAQRGTLKLRMFLETLSAAFPGEPPWDAALIERGLIGPEQID
jgi:DNA-binding transcriptional LysR family regulator